MLRTIVAVTVSRSDYGCLRPVLRRISASPQLELLLVIGGAHLEPRFGLTGALIEQDGFRAAATVPMNLNDNSRTGVARSGALAHAGFVEAFDKLSPDLLLLLGDRFEMHAAAVAAVPFGIPVVHIHGGELTLGAIDDSLRHSLTKLAHVHFTAAEPYRRRVIQMGEEPWRVHTSGAPGIDAVLNVEALDRPSLARLLNLDLSEAPLLVTYHPVTLLQESGAEQIATLVGALSEFDRPIVLTAPNADAGSDAIRARLAEFAAPRPRVRLVENLDTPAYVGMMRIAAAMIGNSSSGLIEAPSFALPVVNIGERQAGRLRAENVIDTPCDRAAIKATIERAVAPAFRTYLARCPNPFGDGRAAERIVAQLERLESRGRLLTKRFHDVELRLTA